MTPNEKLNEVNRILRQKRPAAKMPATNKPDDVASIRHRIEDVRKQISIAFEQAQRLGATKLAAQIRGLSQQLVGLEASLAQVSGVERRLIRLVNKISKP
jgi:hypothetical protein